MMTHLLHSVEFQMSVLLFVALSGYLLASLLRQPAVVGQILAGILIGPSVIGLITYTDFVSSLGHLGAAILLFTIGLEFNIKDLLQLRYAIIGLFGVLVPWVCGFGLALLFDFEPGRASLIGVALSATSIAITADTLRELGKLDSTAAKAIIGAAVIDDVLALLALSISLKASSDDLSLPDIGFMLVKAIVFLAIGVYLSQRYVRHWVTKLDGTIFAQHYTEAVFILAMMLAFAYAIAAEVIGLSAIVGAFVAGVSLEGVHLKHSRNFHEGAEYLRIVFGAIFFVSLGILVDISAFTSGMLVFLLALTAVAIASKLIGCGLPARLMGMSRMDSITIGVGMAPRGEIAMVVALFALNSGAIDQPAYIAIVLMSLLTAVFAPLVLRNWVYRDIPSKKETATTDNH
ncbi:MAG: cation:proton antiporter [Porticoccus sp.]|nr:cation:proton antiporter [Porticoccus sp.]